MMIMQTKKPKKDKELKKVKLKLSAQKRLTAYWDLVLKPK